MASGSGLHKTLNFQGSAPDGTKGCATCSNSSSREIGAMNRPRAQA